MTGTEGSMMVIAVPNSLTRKLDDSGSDRAMVHAKAMASLWFAICFRLVNGTPKIAVLYGCPHRRD